MRIYEKPTASITLNGEGLKVFPLSSGASQGCSLSPLLFDVGLEVLARAIRQEKGKQVIEEGKSKTLFAGDMILCLENHKESTKNQNEQMSKAAGYKNQSYFYTLAMNTMKRKLRR